MDYTVHVDLRLPRRRGFRREEQPGRWAVGASRALSTVAVILRASRRQAMGQRKPTKKAVPLNQGSAAMYPAAAGYAARATGDEKT